MKLTISDSPQFYFGKVRSLYMRFDSEEAAIRAAAERAAVADESVDVFRRSHIRARGQALCRVHPGGAVEFF